MWVSLKLYEFIIILGMTVLLSALITSGIWQRIDNRGRHAAQAKAEWMVNACGAESASERKYMVIQIVRAYRWRGERHNLGGGPYDHKTDSIDVGRVYIDQDGWAEEMARLETIARERAIALNGMR